MPLCFRSVRGVPKVSAAQNPAAPPPRLRSTGPGLLAQRDPDLAQGREQVRAPVAPGLSFGRRDPLHGRLVVLTVARFALQRASDQRDRREALREAEVLASLVGAVHAQGATSDQPSSGGPDPTARATDNRAGSR